nr:pentatricopeptide repeat-containing protein At1g30610, chloroplastic isoform X1 [Ipomoea batatas]
MLRNITATPLPSDSLTVWVSPSVGMVKCNVDAALFDDISGVGAVIRDHAGHFVAAYEAMVSAILTTGSKLTLFFHCILGSNFIRCPCFSITGRPIYAVPIERSRLKKQNTSIGPIRIACSLERNGVELMEMDRAAFKSMEEYGEDYTYDKPRVSKAEMEERIQMLARK